MSIFWNVKQDRVSWTAASIAGIVLVLLFNRPATSQDDLDDIFGTDDNPPAEETESQDDLEDIFGTDDNPPAEETDDVAPEEDENEDVPVIPTEAFRFASPNDLSYLNPLAGEAYLAGHELALQGKYEEAIEFYDQAIAINPRFVDALFERSLALAALEENDLAIQSLRYAVDANGNNPLPMAELNRTLGQQLMEAKLYQDAVVAFGRARQADSLDVDLRLWEASALIRYGLGLRAIDPAGSQEILATGVDLFDELLDEDNTEAEFSFLHGIANYQLGNLEDALDDMKEGERLDPTEWKYLQQIGFIELQLGHLEAVKERESFSELAVEHYQAAIVAFDRYLEANPGNPEDEEQDEDEMEDLFLPIEIYLARSVARISMARQLPKGDLFQESLIGAVADCNAAILLDEERMLAFFNRGTAERLLETYNAALASLTEAIRLDPGNREAHLQRGIVWYYLDESELALGDFQTEAGPEIDPRLHFWSGLVHAKKGDFYEAIKAYSSVLRTNPDHHMARINRGLAYLHIDESEKAIEEFNRLINLDPQNAQAFYYRGLAYELSMLDEEAIGSYRRALTLDPLLEDAQKRLEGLGAQ